MKKVHIVRYVENCTPLMKKFTSVKAMNAFIKKFQKKHPDPYEGWWVDFAIKNVSPKDFLPIDDTVTLE